MMHQPPIDEDYDAAITVYNQFGTTNVPNFGYGSPARIASMCSVTNTIRLSVTSWHRTDQDFTATALLFSTCPRAR